MKKSVLKKKIAYFLFSINFIIFIIVLTCIEFLIDTPKQLLILIIVFIINHIINYKSLKYYKILD